jgi:aspartate racemase
LARHLNESCRYYDGLQYQGLNGGEPMHSSIEEIAAYLIPQMQRIWPHGRYYFCGWSFGGTMACEVARQLEARGLKVQLVLLLDSTCPVQGLRKHSMADLVARLQRDLSKLNGLERVVFLRNLAIGKIRYFLASNKLRYYLSSIKRNYGLKRTENTAPLMQATQQAACKYHPGCYGGRVVLFHSLYSGFRYASDPTFGWGELVRGSLEIIDVPGDHMSMISEPAVSMVAQRIRDCLKEDASEESTAQSRTDSRPLFNPA